MGEDMANLKQTDLASAAGPGIDQTASLELSQISITPPAELLDKARQDEAAGVKNGSKLQELIIQRFQSWTANLGGEMNSWTAGEQLNVSKSGSVDDQAAAAHIQRAFNEFRGNLGLPDTLSLSELRDYLDRNVL